MPGRCTSPTALLSLCALARINAVQVSEKSIARQLQFILDQIECEVHFYCHAHHSQVTLHHHNDSCRLLMTTLLVTTRLTKKMTSLLAAAAIA